MVVTRLQMTRSIFLASSTPDLHSSMSAANNQSIVTLPPISFTKKRFVLLNVVKILMSVPAPRTQYPILLMKLDIMDSTREY
jgi:hypothetical protein